MRRADHAARVDAVNARLRRPRFWIEPKGSVTITVGKKSVTRYAFEAKGKLR